MVITWSFQRASVKISMGPGGGDKMEETQGVMRKMYGKHIPWEMQ